MPDSIDWDFIASLEGKGVTEGYVPDASGSKSGVTIATGFDLGQRNESDLTNLGLSTDLKTKFKPYLGLKGVAAANYLKDNPLTITEAEAADIDKKVKEQKVPLLKERYRTATDNTAGIKFEDLPAQAQTVIASVSFQYGNLSTRTPKFWAAASKQDWVEAVKILRNFGDSYPTRRGKEADLLDQVNSLSTKLAELFSQIPIWNWVLLIAVFGVSCQTTFTQAQPVIFDADLAKAFKNFDQSAAEKRKEITFESGAKASNCTEYWTAKEKSTVKEDIANQLHKSEYLVCDALKIIKDSSKSGDFSTEDKSATNYGKEIFDRLNIADLPSSLNSEKSDKPTFLKDKLTAESSKITKYKIESDTPEWFFAVETVAEIDADRNGKKDLILYVVDQAKEGNYRSYSTWVVMNAEKSGVLKAETR